MNLYPTNKIFYNDRYAAIVFSIFDSGQNGRRKFYSNTL